MKIKEKVNTKAQDLTDNLTMQAQARFIQWLMKEEKCDYEMAMAIVEGRTDPLEPKYMLGFKLANPVLQLALFKQHSKAARRQAAENFVKSLSEEEKSIFYSEVFNEETGKKFKTEYKNAKKDAGEPGGESDGEDI